MAFAPASRGLRPLVPFKAADTESALDPWSTLPDVPTEQNCRMAATALPGNRVFVCGGCNPDLTEPSDAAFILDVESRSWKRVKPLPIAQFGHTCVTLPSGRVFICAGKAAMILFSHNYVYDPEHDRYTSMSRLPMSLYYHGCAALPNGNVLVVGGIDKSNRVSNTVLIGNLETGVWKEVAKMPVALARVGCTTLANGDVLVCGGYAINAVSAEHSGSVKVTFLPTSGVTRYDVVADSWTAYDALPSLPDVAAGVGCVTLPSGLVLAIGGSHFKHRKHGMYSTDVRVLDVQADNPDWVLFKQLPTVRRDFVAAALPNGTVVVMGGRNEARKKPAQPAGRPTVADVFRPCTEWTPAELEAAPSRLDASGRAAVEPSIQGLIQWSGMLERARKYQQGGQIEVRVQRASAQRATDYAAALEQANAIIEADTLQYKTAYSKHLRLPGEADRRNLLEDAVQDLAKRNGLQAAADVSYVYKDPTQGTVYQTNLRGIDPKTPDYATKLFEMFDYNLGAVDAQLESLAKAAAVKYVRGPRKKVERIFEKARLAYQGHLNRVTDYERRSFVCADFAEMARVIEMFPADLEVLRIKNRFSRTNRTAKESGGYRDLQMVIQFPGSVDLLMEVQLHLKVFYELKASVAASEDAHGQTGHERYIEFRGMKELAEFKRQQESVNNS